MNFYKHHLGDYDGATAHLDWTEDMAYRRLLGVCYRSEQPLPADLTATCRLVRASNSAQRKAVQVVLSEFFELKPDGWHNRRADEEIAAYQAQAETNRRIARSRSGTRNNNEPSNDSYNEPSNEPYNDSSTIGTPNHKPLTTNQEPEETKTQPARKKRALAPLPEGWKPSQVTAERLAAEFGLPHDGIERYTAAFHDACAAKGYQYADFNAAFSNCVRQDWPKFRLNGSMAKRKKTAAELIDEAEADRNRNRLMEQPH